MHTHTLTHSLTHTHTRTHTLTPTTTFLQDESAIVTLKESAVTSAEIKEKQAAGAETEREIDDVRTGYAVFLGEPLPPTP